MEGKSCVVHQLNVRPDCVTPYSQYYIVYVVWDLFECAVIWFCAVETKGRTL
jgi:hypothetical protein